MSVGITVLVDDHVDRGGLLAEHGLSLLVEAAGGKTLLDAGQTGVCLHNAERLRADLSDLRRVVLSHGHYDHGGGLPALLNDARSPEVIAHPDAFARKYVRRPARDDRHVGLSYDAEDLARRGATVRVESGAQEMEGGLMATGAIPRETEFEGADAAFQVQTGGAWQADLLDDDQALVARTAEGNVVLLGCAHAGVVNTLRHVARLTGDDRVRAVIGGLHLGGATEERIEKTVAALLDHDVGTVAACHCTGFAAKVRLHAAFGERFVNGRVGLRLTF